MKCVVRIGRRSLRRGFAFVLSKILTVGLYGAMTLLRESMFCLEDEVTMFQSPATFAHVAT